jgi:hypothetical protein
MDVSMTDARSLVLAIIALVAIAVVVALALPASPDMKTVRVQDAGAAARR